VLRERLLAAATVPTARARFGKRAILLASAAAACLLFLGGAWLGYSRGRAPPSWTALRGMVQPLGGATFTHERTAKDEWVRLSEGGLRVEVERLVSGERFRVITGDGEVEVRGTAFEVRALHDRLRSVEVLHGRVEVRRPGHASLLLGPGEHWQAEAHNNEATVAVQDVPALATVPSPPRHAVLPRPRHALPEISHPEVATTSLAPVATPTPAERAFAQGWAALRRSDFAVAAEAFRRAVASGAGEPVLEDARFWLGVALARDEKSDAAITALRDFVIRHPASSRRGEAASILGWQLLKAGHNAEAESRFREAVEDRSPDIRKSARAGLAAVAHPSTP
jgi:TolA-binding protein